MNNKLVGKIIDNSREEFAGFPSSLNGEIFLRFGENGGYYTKSVFDIHKAKENKIAEVSQLFVKKTGNSIINSSLGFPIDARRSIFKNDLQNIEAMIDLGVTKFKDANGNIHDVTADDLKIIKTDMQKYLIDMYYKKWDIENKVKSASTEKELSSILIEL